MASLRLAMGVRCVASVLPAAVRSTGCSSRAFSKLPLTRQPKLCRSMSAALAAKTFVDRQPSPQAEEELVPFSTLKGKINYDTLKAIISKPFLLQNMTSVQNAVLPLLPELVRPYDPNEKPEDGLPPRDLLVRAKTGTGKTLGFLVPAIEARLKSIEAAGKRAVIEAGKTSDKHLEGRARRVFTRTNVGTLIISPTRELATQIANEALRLAHHHDDFEVRLFTGGASKRQQLRDFMKGRRDIVVSTPGRLLDLLASERDIREGIAHTETLILDEADTLLDMGFRDDIDAILKYIPESPKRQTFLFSATVSKAIQQVATRTLSRSYSFIDTVGDNDVAVHERIPQYHSVLPSPADQLPHVLRLIAHDQLLYPRNSKIIVFLPTTRMTQLVATLLRHLSKTCLPSLDQTNVYEIHSKLTQNSRTMASDSFRANKRGSSILVTSDVSARGVDYPGVTRVIQVGIPGGTDQYVHRIGRTGRGSTAVGRGDLVLLSWEVGFLTWRLQDIPIKPLTTNELNAELETLAENYDKDPSSSFWGGEPPKETSPDRRKQLTPYPAQVKDIVSGIDSNVKNLLPKLDEVAIRETFASLLGYYFAKSPELRVQRSVVLEGCRDWTVGACGLSQPPYVSEAFLTRLGFNDNRTKHFGKDFREVARPRGYSVNAPHWIGRGQVKNRTNAPVATTSWGSQRLEPDDPVSNPEEFVGDLYNARRPRQGEMRTSDTYGGIRGSSGMGGFGEGGFGANDDSRGPERKRWSYSDRSDRDSGSEDKRPRRFEERNNSFGTSHSGSEDRRPRRFEGRNNAFESSPRDGSEDRRPRRFEGRNNAFESSPGSEDRRPRRFEERNNGFGTSPRDSGSEDRRPRRFEGRNNGFESSPRRFERGNFDRGARSYGSDEKTPDRPSGFSGRVPRSPPAIET